MERLLEQHFPILSIEQDVILSKMGDITLAYEVRLPEIFTLSNRDYDTLHQHWIKAIKVLPKNTVLHKQDWFVEKTYQAEFSHVQQSFLSQSSERFFHERPFLDHTCFLYLTLKPKNRKPASSMFSTLLRSHIIPEELQLNQSLPNFQDACGQLERILIDSGFMSLKRLTEKELLSSSSRAGLLENYCRLSLDSDPRFIHDIQFKPSLQIGNKHARIFSLSDPEDLPQLCGSRINYDKYSTDHSKFSVGFAAALGQLLPCNHLYNQYLFLGDSQQTLKTLEAKRLRLQSLANYSRENAISRDSTNAFLNEAISQQRLPVKAHFNLLVWTEAPTQLPEIKKLVGSAFTQLDATAKEESVGAPQIFWAGIPGNSADFPMNETFDTFVEQATCFFHQETGYQSSISPFGIRLGDRLTGKPLQVDLSDEPVKRGIITNRNKFILGPSGSGKSFFTNHLVRSYYEQGTHVVLVDVGHSYKGLCELVQGYYFTYDEQHPICFNPFYIPTGEQLDTEKKESIKTLLLALWKKDHESFKRSEYVALSNALKGYYEKLKTSPSLFPGFNSFYEYLQEDFYQDLETDQVKEKDFDISNFLYVLRPYYQGGEFDYLLNAKENLDLLQERFIVFELDNIKDHPILFPVVTIIIMEVFIHKMRKLKGIRKLILIEEAWKAIAKEGMAEYIKYLFKTVRKFYGEAIVVTQEVDDIISSPIVKQTIINNSDCKILLDQSKYQNKFHQIQELLGLTAKEKALVLSVNQANDPKRRYKEVFISLGGMQSKVYRTEVSKEEYLAYTTEEREKIKVMEYAARFGSVQKGIQALCSETEEQN
ncbi:TraG family conjugative transposon ATPase [Algoriphagus halophilus]|uniref:Bacteroides conjugation system ATPase, TraG family n=1 Tax=Algoriphagus halophilus TaxID=226505 RepID=A0A1N6E6V7_9BACT|nr:TraG family conjugative transposon ATPase [Algoriphagus halophilus]SIN78721.1 Bacteroides conjugation system ATPase, TraG family [Algoriphagus halophilus]